MTNNTKPGLLIVDDDPQIADTLAQALGNDFEPVLSDSRAQAINLLRQLREPPPLALVDLGLPPVPQRPDEGFRLITELLAHSPHIKILALTDQNDTVHARHARALGAFEFVAKPCEPEQLRKALTQALAFRRTEMSGSMAVEAGVLIGRSPAMQKLRSQISQYADSPFPALIEGESGSGKELVANALHRLSSRKDKPFLALNCAAIEPDQVEPALFGCVQGACPGAQTVRSGYLEDAADGTLFLDEVGELPPELQAKLLRVLENGEYQRMGETQRRYSRARIIAATNRDLRQEIRKGRFRADLYHRLSVFTVTVPPLREMDDDKLLLLEHFRAFYAERAQMPAFMLDEDATKRWLQYHFPGNVRELRNIVIRLTTKYAGQRLSVMELEQELDVEPPEAEGPALALSADPQVIVEQAQRHLQRERAFSLDNLLRSWEQGYIEAAMKLTRGNVSQAARLLGINRTTLYSRMESLQKQN